MIVLTKLNDAPIAVNCDLIEFIEETPDTVITLLNNDKIVVLEPMQTVVEKIVRYRRRISSLIEWSRTNVPPVLDGNEVSVER